MDARGRARCLTGLITRIRPKNPPVRMARRDGSRYSTPFLGPDYVHHTGTDVTSPVPQGLFVVLQMVVRSCRFRCRGRGLGPAAVSSPLGSRSCCRACPARASTPSPAMSFGATAWRCDATSPERPRLRLFACASDRGSELAGSPRTEEAVSRAQRRELVPLAPLLGAPPQASRC